MLKACMIKRSKVYGGGKTIEEKVFIIDYKMAIFKALKDVFPESW